MINNMLKIITIMGIIWLIVNSFFYISDIYSYSENLKEFPIKYKDTIDDLFAQCPQKIDISDVPRKFEDLKEKKFKYDFLAYSVFFPADFPKGTQLKNLHYNFLRSLGDKPELGKSYSALSSDEHTRAYYDYRNKLLYVEKEVKVAKIGICDYSSDGVLLRAAFSGENSLKLFFNPEKKLTHICGYMHYCSSDKYPVLN